MAGEGASGTAGTLEVVPISAVEGPLHLLESAVTTTAVAQGTLVDALTDPSTGKAVDLQALPVVTSRSSHARDSATTRHEGGPGPGFGPTGTGPGIGGIAERVGPLGNSDREFRQHERSRWRHRVLSRFHRIARASRGVDQVLFDTHTGVLSTVRREGRRRRDAARWH